VGTREHSSFLFHPGLPFDKVHPHFLGPEGSEIELRVKRKINFSRIIEVVDVKLRRSRIENSRTASTTSSRSARSHAPSTPSTSSQARRKDSLAARNSERCFWSNLVDKLQYRVDFPEFRQELHATNIPSTDVLNCLNSVSGMTLATSDLPTQCGECRLVSEASTKPSAWIV
jgi:hypothetical protein